MTLKKMLSAAALASCVPLSATAAEVDSTQVPVFESGQPARAADVNNAFAALIEAINENASRISTLETELDKATNDEVAGRSYFLVLMNASLSADGQRQFSHVALRASEFQVDFHENGTGTVSGFDGTEYELGLPHNELSAYDGELFEETFTYQDFGGYVEITLPPEDPGAAGQEVYFNVSPDGNVLTGFIHEARDDSFGDGPDAPQGQRTDTELFIGVAFDHLADGGTASTAPQR